MNEINSTNFPSTPSTTNYGQPWAYSGGDSFELLPQGSTDDAMEGFLKYQMAPDTFVDTDVSESDVADQETPSTNEPEPMIMGETNESQFTDARAEGGGDPY